MKKDSNAPIEALEVWKSAAIFYLIACGFSWLVWAPLVLGPGGLKLHHVAVPVPVTVCVGTLGPLIACFVTHHRQTGNWRAVHLLPGSPRQWVWLLLGPLLILFCRCFVFAALITKGGPAAWHWHIGAFAGIWVPMFNYNLFGGPLFEEFGWRGFLQPQFQKVFPPWFAAICVGIPWALWHLPLFLIGWGGVSLPIFVLIVIGASTVMAVVFNASGQAVVVGILMHSAFNASNGFVPGFLGNVATREHPSEGLLIACSFLLVGIVAMIFTRGRMSVPPKIDINRAVIYS